MTCTLAEEQTWETMLYRENRSARRFIKIPAGSYEAEQIYFDDGTEFRQCSIAVEWEKHILMGSPGADFMICTRK